MGAARVDIALAVVRLLWQNEGTPFEAKDGGVLGFERVVAADFGVDVLVHLEKIAT